MKLYVLAIALMLFACESPTDNQIEQARNCSDNASKIALSAPTTAATAAAACEAIIVTNNLQTNQSAAAIQFGDILIENQLISGIDQAATSGTKNVNGLGGMISVLVPTNPPSGSNATNEATRMLTSANNSGDPSLINVASLINIATTLNTLAGLVGTGATQGQVVGAINGCTGTCATNLQSEYNTLAASACTTPPPAGSTTNLCSQAQAINASCTSPCTGSNFTTALANYVNSH